MVTGLSSMTSLAPSVAHIHSLQQQRVISPEEVRGSIDVTYLSGIDRGQRNPSLRNLRRLAVALGVPVKEPFSFE